MHRGHWYRALMALWALWFTTARVLPAGRLACAMHGEGARTAVIGVSALAEGHADAQSDAAIPSNGHANHASHARSAESMAGARHHESGPDLPTGNHCCSCLGECCAASPAAPPVDVLARAILPRAIVASVVLDTTVRVAAREHVQPFAHAPPAGVGMPLVRRGAA